ncbi:hypothetical protein DUNSADRAFT_16250 [Dunaliella salina]|uniref:Uncharacterized protein n=1 Tax=Dunaliella salina TaxID=3046 RepID=A0ABQ7H1B4_DUNSA|nr:hypothetical protein DUNSADRAFT_16250 [Dunaliella salina]|eukprot:KAF5840587.1 hypothetical protein DUNSADRAFT_16250 [Dunaliella salina]
MQGHTGAITTLRSTHLPIPDSAASGPADSGSGVAYAQGGLAAQQGVGAQGVHASGSTTPCVISASRDWTVRVWDVGSTSARAGGCCAVLQGHAGPVHALHVVQPPTRRDWDCVPRVGCVPSAEAGAGGAASAGEGVSEGGAAASEVNGPGAGDGSAGGGQGVTKGGMAGFMGGPLLVSGGGDGALGLWDLSAAVAQPPSPLLSSQAPSLPGTGGAASWDGASAAGGALPGCVCMQRVHGRGVCLLEEGTAAVGGGLVLSGAEDGSMAAWRVQLPGWGCLALTPALLPPPPAALGGGGCVMGGGSGEVVQHWSPHAAYQAWRQAPLAGLTSPIQLQQPQQQQKQQQFPLQCLGWQAARAASTCMALDPMTGVVVSGGHDGQLRAWAPFGG